MAVTFLLAAGVAGCGGGDDESPESATATSGETGSVAITKAGLIGDADEICAEVNAAISAIDGSTADESSKSEQRGDIYDGLAERLGQLGTPSDGDPPSEVIAAAQDLADGGGDVTAFQTAAADYGFTECAEASETSIVGESPEPGAVTDPGVEEAYAPPVTTPEESYTPPETTPPPPTDTGGGVSPEVPETGGSTGGGSSGGSSGGIGPG